MDRETMCLGVKPGLNQNIPKPEPDQTLKYLTEFYISISKITELRIKQKTQIDKNINYIHIT